MSKKKGWSVRVEIDGFQEGASRPEKWQDLPTPVQRSILAISEAPEVECVEVISGVKHLASFAPRDTEALVGMLQGLHPALARVLRESKDTKLADEVRALLLRGAAGVE